MPQLAISKEFLGDYAKLERAVQAKVQRAIVKFQEVGHPGLHPEKVQAADPRVRTIRIDQFWRGVVLAPESGEVFCLLKVLPHDEAYAYLARRRFSVNQALGVLESRDEVELETLEPELRESARAVPRLFDKINDADMKRLGIDAQILPIVRLLTADTHLDSLASLLPANQYDTLVALAAGMKPDEVWAELAQRIDPLPDPQDVDPEDLVAAMERTPDQVAFVEADEELAKILAYPFDAWRTFLHPSQRKIAYRDSYPGSWMVTGGAGTGKTVTALHRAAYLARRYEGPFSCPILVTTFSRNLATSIGRQLDLLIDDEVQRSRIEVINTDRLAYRIVSDDRRQPLEIADGPWLDQLWRAAAAAAGVTQPPSFLKLEWEQVVLSEPITTRQRYLEFDRKGRGIALSPPHRERVWDAIVHASGELRRSGRWTFLQLADEAARIVRENGISLYRHVIVDEAQDLHPAQWRLLRAITGEDTDDLFIVGDPYQRIYANHVSLSAQGIEVRGRSRRLTVSYRTTEEILAWSVPVLNGARPIGLDDNADSLTGYGSPLHGSTPRVRGYEERSAELDGLVEQVSAWLKHGVESHAIGVAARTTQLARDAQARLLEAEIKAVPLTTVRKDGVRTGTMHRLKGLEFQCVAVIGAEAGLVPAQSAITPIEADPIANKQDLQRERCLLFVASTRARESLYISYTGNPSIFLTV